MGTMYNTPGGAYTGHDEATNDTPKNVPGTVYASTGSTFAPIDTGASGGTTSKNSLGTTGKADGQE